ncbi:hypothetical protein FHS56_002322 [Thermonema lapsum]|uniref:DUF1795 domain-containing protein n=1 Tax=Thermonema lapsum TaxID=28195 RepID=A0A846MTL4_9BACT|nr:hypothetical protein [Thermonema lapsum]NIK74789.1 hypothetical protein [Thermonema lapsum]
MILRQLWVVVAIFALSCFAFGGQAQSSIKLKRRQLTPGISMLVPVDFQPMSDDFLAQKYAYFRKPTVMLSDPYGNIDLGVNITEKYWPQEDIPLLKDIYKATLAALYTQIHFHKEAVEKIKHRTYVILEFDAILADEAGEKSAIGVTKPPVKRYYYMMYTVVDNRIVVFNFNAPIQDKALWQPVADKIMHSVKLKNIQLPKEQTPLPDVPSAQPVSR